MSEIEIDHLVKDYGDNKGVFDISISVNKGEVYGFLGPNGAGKSTTMRHLMGFSHPDKGSIELKGLECWSKQKKIQSFVGYLPGEISFPNDMNGKTYIKLIAKLRHMRDMSYADELLKRFEIDPNMSLKRMSKGMKQKIGIVTAFMHDPDIILLDEPTSGLDPLMQNRFMELIEQEKQRGKTIFMSSHIFEEVEKMCDRIGMIKNGKMIQEFYAKELRMTRVKSYKMEFHHDKDFKKILSLYPDSISDSKKKQLIISIKDESINELIQQLALCSLIYLKEEKHTLEEYFMKFYGGNEND